MVQKQSLEALAEPIGKSIGTKHPAEHGYRCCALDIKAVTQGRREDVPREIVNDKKQTATKLWTWYQFRNRVTHKIRDRILSSDKWIKSKSGCNFIPRRPDGELGWEGTALSWWWSLRPPTWKEPPEYWPREVLLCGPWIVNEIRWRDWSKSEVQGPV